MMQKPRLIVIEGATATGKSDCAIRLAKRIGGEIVSADSMQVYRGLDIGTGKVMPDDMDGVAHHMIDVAQPDESFDIAQYAPMASACIMEVLSRGHVPILCGGTGFYIQAVLKGIDFSDGAPDPSYREELEQIAENRGVQELHDMLSLKDPASAAAIHPHNKKRIIRALEYMMVTGEPLSQKNAMQKERPYVYDAMVFHLTMDRARLYERIEQRVDAMMNAGLLEEVEGLVRRGLTEAHGSMQGLGYKEFFPVFAGEITQEEAVRILKRDTRHYAKRQLTWFFADANAIEVRVDTYASMDDVVDWMVRRIHQGDEE